MHCERNLYRVVSLCLAALSWSCAPEIKAEAIPELPRVPSTEPQGPEKPGVQPEKPDEVPTVLLENINGAWSTECLRAESGLFKGPFRPMYQRREMHIDDQNITVFVSSHREGTCSDESADSLAIAFGKMKRVAKVGGIENADFTFDAVSLLALSPDGADDLNEASPQGTCETSDWDVGVPKEVQDADDCPYAATLGLVPFNIVTLDNERLTFGDYLDPNFTGSSNLLRPVALLSGKSYGRESSPRFEAEGN